MRDPINRREPLSQGMPRAENVPVGLARGRIPEIPPHQLTSYSATRRIISAKQPLAADVLGRLGPAGNGLSEEATLWVFLALCDPLHGQPRAFARWRFSRFCAVVAFTSGI